LNTDSDHQEARNGLIAGFVCYLLWGIFPVYFKWVEAVNPVEVVLHRVIWAVPFGALIIHLRGQWREVKRALTHRLMLPWLMTSAFFISINWYLYIVAVQGSQIFQASLGYYINPLLFVLAGVVLLGERLRFLQAAAVLLAGAGVLVLTMSGGEFPFIAIGLGVSFATYGVIRKRIVIGAMPGLFVETLVLAPLAVFWLLHMGAAGAATFMNAGYGMNALLLLAGPLTVIPLLLFALAARRLSLTTLGFMQFLAPTLQFCVALFYGEQFTTPRMICFLCIWIAVTLFSADAIRNSRRPVSDPAAK
jgi:chloramphenicol-sensitive protein RarD